MDASAGKPSGQLTVNAGFADGIQEGMTGVVWRKNKIKGQIELADVTVVSVTADDALCKYVLRVADLPLLKKDRVALIPVVPDEAAILARGIAALENRQCCEALLYFQRIFCLSRENSFVMSQISQCLAQFEAKMSGGLTEAEKQSERKQLWPNLELAEGHHQYGNYLAADLFLRRVGAVDSANAQAAALRDSIPAQNLAGLFSPERCK
jgi:hypothetical protein